MAISRSQLIQKVRNRLGEPLVKVELCDVDISEHIDYARQKFIKWAIGNATQEVYFTILLQAGKRLYDLPAGITDVIEYNDRPLSSGSINTLFTIDNYMFSQGMYGNAFYGGYDLISYHLVLDFLTTLSKYVVSKYNYKYHRSTNQIEINPAPPTNEGLIYTMGTDPDTGHPQEYVFDSPGFIMLRAYMVQGTSLPYYRPEWDSYLKEIKTIVEERDITTTDITNKSLLLNHTPLQDVSDKLDFNVPEDIKVTINGLATKKYVDYDQLSTNTRVITWDALGLEDNISVGDKVVISYPVLFESEYYPDDWTNVTATSKEVEQFTLNQNHIDTGKVKVAWPIWDDNVKLTAGGITHQFGDSEDFTIDSDQKTITWKALGLDGAVEVGDVLVVTYVAVRSKRPDSRTANKSVIRQYTTRIENRTLTNDEITNKFLLLDEDVSVADGMKMTVGSFDRVYGVDFRLDGTKTVSWDGLALDGTDDLGNPLLNADDPVVITYTSATFFEREVEEDLYDEDWILDYVTAMSKISLGIVRRKFASFNSLGNQGISLDGDSMVSEGMQEKENLEITLRDEEAHEGYGIEIGLM